MIDNEAPRSPGERLGNEPSGGRVGDNIRGPEALVILPCGQRGWAGASAGCWRRSTVEGSVLDSCAVLYRP